MVISMENNKFKPINGYELNAWVGINQTKKMMISNTTRAQSMANSCIFFSYWEGAQSMAIAIYCPPS